MDLIKVRNAQTGLKVLRTDILPNYASMGGEDEITLPGAFTLVSRRPMERVITWPGLGRNPAQELTNALISLVQTEKLIGPVVTSLAEHTPGFHLTTPTLIVRFRSGPKGVDVIAVTSEPDLMIACFGTIFLQLSILQEVVAAHAGLDVGTLTLTQTDAVLTSAARKAVFCERFDPKFHDGYTVAGCTPVPIRADLSSDLWSDFKMYIAEHDKAVGYKTSFIRHVMLPMYQAAQLAGTDMAAAEKMVERISASDWKRAMTLALSELG